jgi:hypothetical protein
LPDLRNVGLIALDTETKDDRLTADLGPGWPMCQGHLCGTSIAYRGEGVHGLYFPLRHPDSQNFDSEQVYKWLRDHIAAGVRVVTQNGLYDWGWLRSEAGIHMPEGKQIEEIGALATLIDENRFSYGLDNLCKWRGLPGKDEALLREAIVARGFVKLNKTGKNKGKPKPFVPQKYIHLLPARDVGPYAEQDTISTLLLYENLDPILDQEGTRDAYRLDCDILPMVLEMQLRGMRVDITKAERNRDLLYSKRDVLLAELSEKLEVRVGMDELHKDAWLASTFDRIGVKYPRTEKGNPSFQGGNKGWMTGHAHWLPSLVFGYDVRSRIGCACRCSGLRRPSLYFGGMGGHRSYPARAKPSSHMQGRGHR